MRTKSVLTESQQIGRAVALIELGARLQVLECETDLSYERLLRLYKEVAGKSPSKGQLPFSTDWFLTWQPNIHASLFLNIHEYLNKIARARRDRRRHQGLPALPGADHGAGPRAAAVDHARLAPGALRRQQHADDDQVLEVRRPVRHRAVRDRPPLRLRPVRAAGARRQGQGRRRHPPALSSCRRRRPTNGFKSPGAPITRVLCSFLLVSSSTNLVLCSGSFGTRFLLPALRASFFSGDPGHLRRTSTPGRGR